MTIVRNEQLAEWEACLEFDGKLPDNAAPTLFATIREQGEEMERMREDAARWRHVLENHLRAGSPHMDNTWAYYFAGALRGRWETPEQAVDAARKEANGL